MKIPDKVKIGRSTWKVIVSDSIDSYGAIGLCVYGDKEIFLSPNQTRNEMEETFLHELLHACWPDDECSPKLEEKLISKLSPILLKTLKANKVF